MPPFEESIRECSRTIPATYY